MHSMIPDGEIPTNKPINFNYDQFCCNTTVQTVSLEQYTKLEKERDELKEKCEKLEQQLEDLGIMVDMKNSYISYLEAIVRTVEALTDRNILKG